mmetsp:Transcript_21185/g.44288  ORF Transcript_21185/g.44288 Transcript_21185/m.44288 type:complete len:150 (+) Transcript_21185:162-611(+)
MGCCCAKAAPVPDERLLGTWVNVPEAAQMRIGFAQYRNKRGYNLQFRTQANGHTQDPETVWIRLIIEAQQLHYLEIEARTGRYVLLDAPVIAWESNRLYMGCCGGEHVYALQEHDDHKSGIIDKQSNPESGPTLLFDGHLLLRHKDPPK